MTKNYQHEAYEDALCAINTWIYEQIEETADWFQFV